MAETVFQNLRVRGTLTLVGLTTLVTAVVTTLTVTTGNFTTANIQTLSGTTILATEVGDSIEGTTISGATIRNTAGTFLVDGTDVETTVTISGTTLRMSGTMSGASTLTLSALGGSVGSAICVKTNGTLGTRPVSATGSLNGGSALCN